MGMPILKKVWIIDAHPQRAMNLAIKLGIARRAGWWLLDRIERTEYFDLKPDRQLIFETPTAHQTPEYAMIRARLRALKIPVFAESIFEERGE